MTSFSSGQKRRSRHWAERVIRILAEGDHHCGEVLGLANPEHWPKRKRRLAQLVWDWRSARLKEIGRVDIHIAGGDLVEGHGRKDTLGLLTTDLEEQAAWAEEAIREVKADHRFFTYGTPFHVVGLMKTENLIARAFGQRPQVEWPIGPLHGVRVLDRHAISNSSIPYGQGTPMWKEWVRDQIQAVMEDYKAADLHIRHHVHWYFQMRNVKGHVVTCPTWKLRTPLDGSGSPFPWGLRPQYYDVGNLLIEIDRRGEVYVRPQIMPMKLAIPREYVCPEIKENSSAVRKR
jgi:hypothetical protein